MVAKMSELKICPFCGGEAKIDCYLYFDEFDDWFIRCTSCFCRTRTFKTKKSAILTWNNRKPMERIVEQLEAMQDNLPAELSHCHEFYVEGMFEGLNRGIKIVKEEGGL